MSEQMIPAGSLPLDPEALLLQQAQAGDSHAFEGLYRIHKRRVYSLCLRMLGSVPEAEDLTQEAFLLLHRKIKSFRGDSAFTTWLHRLTVNVVLMHLRRKGLSLVPLSDASETPTGESIQRELGNRDPILSGSVDRITLERAIQSLPPGYRFVFLLHDVEGYEHNEIAKMLECSVGNSKSQLHKARLKLREILRKRPHGGQTKNEVDQ
jgi:RNA polymerase sigma-70 factor (ECF subfamily)